jgi:hypothetical protein
LYISRNRQQAGTKLLTNIQNREQQEMFIMVFGSTSETISQSDLSGTGISILTRALKETPFSELIIRGIIQNSQRD